MKKNKYIPDFDDIPTPRQKMPHLSLEERKLSFKEVELGFNEEMAMKEVRRCLSCRRCIGCGLCLAECDQQAIVYDQTAEHITVRVDSIVMANGAESFDARRIPELGYNDYPNVVTNIELERILNANGPYDGILMRPSDGDVPKKMAFIQCVGSRNELLGTNYCSNICCITALKQAMVAKDKVKNLEITIFYTDIRPFAKNSENYYQQAKNEYGIKFIPAKLEEVKEIEANDNLTIKFQKNGESEKLEFDLVVLSTGLVPSGRTKSLSRKVGVRLNKYGFLPGTAETPIPTSGEDVWFAGSMSSPADIANSLTQASAVAAKVLQTLRTKDVDFKRALLKTADSKGVKNSRPGVFLCLYGVKTHLSIDTEQLLESIRQSHPDVFVTASEYACNITGKNTIEEAIEKEKLGQIIIAPCYRDTHEMIFQHRAQAANLPADSVKILDIGKRRDGFDAGEIEKKISELINSHTEKKIAVSSKEPLLREAAVIGGSVGALQTALEIATLGYPVHVFPAEEDTLNTENEIFWHHENFEELFKQLKERVAANEKIQIHHQSECVSMEGNAGRFKLTIKEKGKETSLSAGAVVLATGGQAYHPHEFLYGELQQVITQRELYQLLSAKEFLYNHVVMIQCVGSRQKEHPYCSQLCCEQAVKNALKIKEVHPQADVYILHRDVRVYDFEEDNYSEALENNIHFLRMDTYPDVRFDKKKLIVDVVDGVSGEKMHLNTELIVLSTGITTRPITHQVAKTMRVKITQDGFFQEIDSTFNPLETGQKGVFIVGLSHSPQRLEGIMTQATAIAGRIGLLFQ